ncbi:FAD-binding oxidoreductase [Acetobacteraceae bacterium H6797]|nr:FAD-binding oxidoreductase [Acetobacteraceae bacterium H6797]
MDTYSSGAIVIGAGMAGASAAAFLSATRKVALLEAEETAGYHTTGRSAAIWLLNYGPQDVRALSAASRPFFEAPPPGFTDAPLMSSREILFLAPSDEPEALHQLLLTGEGLEEISVARAREMIPAIREGYAVGAAVERGGVDMEVAALHQGFLRQVKLAGGTVALRHRAGRVWREKGLWHAETSAGAVFTAPVIVNAAGAWGDEVALAAGVSPLGLVPKRRTAVIIDPAPFDCAGWPMVEGVGQSEWYARAEARRKLMVSPVDETPSAPCDAQPDELDIAIAVDRFTRAMDIEVRRVEHSWAGLRTFTPDGSLALGAGSEPGFYWSCGQGGYGIQTGPAAGRLVADLIEGREPEDALKAILPLVDPARFAKLSA